MNLTSLISRNIWFHRKQYLAVFAGVVISTTVLTGALIVGDSVRFSLQRLTDIRLGKIRYVLQSNERYVRQELATEISRSAQVRAVPAMFAAGIAINSDKDLRINQVQVYGVDQRFLTFWDHPVRAPGKDEAVISRNVAGKLNLKEGDDLLLRLQNRGRAPANAPFVAEIMPSVSIRVRVSAIADDNDIGRFNLKINQTDPYNIFLPIDQMADLLGLPGYANTVLVAGKGSMDLMPDLEGAMEKCFSLDDAGIVLHKLTGSGNYEITSDRIFIGDSIARIITRTIPGCEVILTYLVNSISAGNRSTPYSFVTAAGEAFLKTNVGEKQIVINEWLAKDLGVGAGDSVMLRYFLMGAMRSLREDSSRFMVRTVLPPGNELSDPGLMPAFPGMTDAGNCRDWETGAPVDLKRIRPKDEQYWKDHRGTPKAFIAIDCGQKMWDNRFGHCTAIRFRAKENDIPGIERSLLSEIKPGREGLFFKPVYMEGQLAARNSTDFGELFLGLSFFIMLSALLLTAMLFSLLARSRLAETGVLATIGFRKTDILGILSVEVLMVVIPGAIAGACAGILYNYLIIAGLQSIWQDAVNTSLLVMNIRPATLLKGAGSGIIVAFAVLLFIVWKNLREPTSMLVRNGYGMRDAGYAKTNPNISLVIAMIFIIGSLALWVWLLFSGAGQNTLLFLVAGGLLLAGLLALQDLIMARSPGSCRDRVPGLRQLTIRNLSLSRIRTLSAITLLALGCFTLLITGANRKALTGNDMNRKSGTGGFILWAESTLPVMNDLNSAHGAGIFGLRDEEVLKQVQFIQLPGTNGDDASCLNLNQVSRPGIIGIPAAHFDRLGACTFANLDPSVDKNRPWSALSACLAPGVIPGYADQSVIQWGLRKSPGDTLLYRDEAGNILYVKLLGGLDHSIFQGSILVSDSLLRIYFPSTNGSRIMLIDGPSNLTDTIAQRLETIFRDFGLLATPASARLASFNAVENTYLSVFMLLGGLGIILGTIGLGIVLLRNLSQRRQELALYVALGYSRKFIFKMILLEHLLILLSGLVTGLISASPVILPLMISLPDKFPWSFYSIMIAIILINGLLWIYIPARKILSGVPLSGLRAE